MPRRPPDTMRPVAITPHFLAHPEGSALIAFGDTKVICTASVEERVPGWLVGKGRGWVTGEYDMLPRATTSRRDRDARSGRVNGRTQEISRLVGRALRSVVDLERLGERTVTVDCDVIQADGGTRTAAITGACVAMALAFQNLRQAGRLKHNPLKQHVAAVSVGLLDGEPVLDLDYSMDSRADVDMNVVMTEDGALAEVQGTGEGTTFKREQLNTMLDLAFGALPMLIDVQKRALDTPLQPELITVRAP